MLFPITDGSPVAKITAFHYITIPRQVYVDFCAIVDHFDTEVSGCGLVERVEHRYKGLLKSDPDVVEIQFKVLEVFLPTKQTNTKASTEIDEEEIFKLQNRLLAENKNTELLRMHWHSHADMGVFHSGTDEENYATLSGGDFLVSLVLNKEHKFLGRVDYFKPVRVMLSDLSVRVVLELEDTTSMVILDSIKALDEYEKEQNTKSTVVVYNGGQGTSYKDIKDDVGEDRISETEQIMEDIEIARQLSVPISDALRYRKCMQVACDCCKEVSVCHEYLYHIDRLSTYPER